MQSIDAFFDRKYDTHTYNCMHFASEVWGYLTEQDILPHLQGLVDTPNIADRAVRMNNRRSFTRLTGPKDPCVAFMQRTRTTPHMGVFMRKRILHITEKGVQFQPPRIAALGFDKVSYYMPHDTDHHSRKKFA